MAASTPYQFVSADDQPGGHSINITVPAMSAISAATLVTDYVPGYPFEILGVDFLVTTAVTTGSKGATITPQVDGVNVPGASLVLAGTYALGAFVAGTSASGTKVYGTASSKIRLVGSAVTAFTEGAGQYNIRLRALGGSAV